MSDWTLRWIPRHFWVRLALCRTRGCDPEHGWLYAGLVRRDVWQLGPISLVLLRMPHRRSEVET